MFKDKLIQATFWSNLFYSMSYPYIHLITMKVVNEAIISINTVVICLSTILINSIWNKKSARLYKLLPYLMMIESGLYLIISIMLAFCTTFSPLWYYILDTVIFSAISRNVICGATKLRTLVYPGEQREKYDNTVSTASCLSTVMGAGLIILIDIPTQVAIMLSWVGVTIDNVFYFLEYKNHKTIPQDNQKGGTS